MPKAKNQWEDMASKAAERIERSRAAGAQLKLLPDEPDGNAKLPEAGGSGRGKGKVSSELRKMFAARGWRMPEDVLAQMAGLDGRGDALETAMARTEQVLAFAYGNAEVKPETRLSVFMQLYAAQHRALDALMPYGLAKITPDSGGVQVNTIVVQGGDQAAADRGADRAGQARDVTPKTGRMAPPPLPNEIQQNQSLECDRKDRFGKSDRTE